MAVDTSWTFDPGAIVLMSAAVALYGARWRTVRAEQRAVGAQRAGTAAGGAGVVRAIAFATGIVVVATALVSPVDRLAEQVFMIHMVQHLLLIDIAPILLIVGLTKVLLRPATRRLMRIEDAAGWLGHPVFAVFAYVLGMWAWHVPALYDAALEHPAIHALEHITFAGIGLLYWWHLLSPIRSRMRLGGMGPVLYMVGTKLLVGLLGIGLTFAPHALYHFYEHAPRVWGLSAHDDQQLAGAVMAVEQSVVMGIVLAWLFVRMLAESEREEERAERYEAA